MIEVVVRALHLRFVWLPSISLAFARFDLACACLLLVTIMVYFLDRFRYPGFARLELYLMSFLFDGSPSFTSSRPP